MNLVSNFCRSVFRSDLDRQDSNHTAMVLYARITLAVVLIMGSVLGGHFVYLSAVRQAAHDAELINVSGRQRMLSQKILLSTARYLETGNPFYTAQLETALTAFDDANDWLLDNISGLPELERLYLQPDGPVLGDHSRRLVAEVRALISTGARTSAEWARFDRIEADVQSGLITDLNQSVKQFESQAEARLLRQVRVQNWSVVAAFLGCVIGVIAVLVPSVQTVVRSMRRLDKQANTDTLTGLANRAQMTTQLERALAEASPHARDGLVVVFLDLDGFKGINDTLGHPVGDEVLIHISRLLMAATEQVDTLQPPVVARMGGDEFAMLLLFEPSEVPEVVDRLAADLIGKASAPVNIVSEIGEVQCLVGVSLGYVTASEPDATADRLLSDADIALYESKSAGKGRATHFEIGMRDNAERRHRLETDIRRAILASEFEPFYQPQIDFKTGRFVGFEVLVRWRHPMRGVVEPGEFIATAEDARVIEMIDGSVIFRAMEEVARMESEGFEVPKLSLNASAPLLRDPEFVNDLLEICRMYNFPPSKVTVEVLESTVIEDQNDPAAQSVLALAAAGCGAVIDDFGTGYSSLSTVSALEITGLKIDRGLIRDYNHDKTRKILAATIAMAHSMGLTLVAEGIETQHQFDVLRDMDCEIAQGFLIGAPADYETALRWLRAHVQRQQRPKSA